MINRDQPVASEMVLWDLLRDFSDSENTEDKKNKMRSISNIMNNLENGDFYEGLYQGDGDIEAIYGN